MAGNTAKVTKKQRFVEDVVNFVNDKITSTELEKNRAINERVERLTKVNRNFALCLENFKAIVEEIAEAFYDLGLDMSVKHITKTGFSAETWEDGDHIRIDIVAQPLFTNGFRWVKGAAAVRKAVQMENAIGHGIEINQFSLDGENGRVLATLWVKL